jgi:hypothetical protein
MLGEITSGHRPEGRGRDDDRGEISLIAPAFTWRNGLADQRLGRGHQAAATEPLQQARQRKENDARRQGAEHGCGDEDRERHIHHAAAPEGIPEAPIDGSRDCRRDEIGDHDPGDLLDASERAGDRRKRGRHDCLIRHREKHRQHDRGEDREEKPCRRGRGRRGCGVIVRGGGQTCSLRMMRQAAYIRG